MHTKVHKNFRNKKLKRQTSKYCQRGLCLREVRWRSHITAVNMSLKRSTSNHAASLRPAKNMQESSKKSAISSE